MTTSVTEPRIAYSGNGSSVDFTIPFDFKGNDEVTAFLITNSTNDVVTWTNPTNYSISGTTLTAVIAPASGTTLVVQLNVALTQSTDYIENDAFSAEAHEAALDKLTRMVKELKAIVDYQCVKLPVNRLSGTTVNDTDIGNNKYFRTNSTGSGIELADGTTVAVSDSALSGLIDVNISGATVKDLIVWSGTEWINTTISNYDVSLGALYGLSVVNDKLPYFNGTGTATTTDFTAFARSLLDDASASTARGTLGLGTIATQNSSNVAITGGSVSNIVDLAVTDGGTGASNPTDARFNLGLRIGEDVQEWYPALDSIGNLTTAADKMIYTTALDTYAVTDLTSFARTILDDTDATTARATLGLVIGTNVQAWGANLDTLKNLSSVANLSAIANLTSAADKLGYYTGAGAAALTDLTAFARTILDDTSAANVRTTLGITDEWIYLGELNSGNSFATTSLLTGYSVYKLILEGELGSSLGVSDEFIYMQLYGGGGDFSHTASTGHTMSVSSSLGGTPLMVPFQAESSDNAGNIVLSFTPSGGFSNINIHMAEITIRYVNSSGNALCYLHCNSAITDTISGFSVPLSSAGIAPKSSASLTGIKVATTQGLLTSTANTKIKMYGLRNS